MVVGDWRNRRREMDLRKWWWKKTDWEDRFICLLDSPLYLSDGLANFWIFRYNKLQTFMVYSMLSLLLLIFYQRPRILLLPTGPETKIAKLCLRASNRVFASDNIGCCGGEQLNCWRIIGRNQRSNSEKNIWLNIFIFIW